MGNVQAVLLAAWHITQLYSEGRTTPSTVGMFKAWVTERGRLITALGREIMGGNGVLMENGAIKHMLDM